MWRTFGTVVGVRTPSGREEYLQYHSSAIAIPSPAHPYLLEWRQIAFALTIFFTTKNIHKAIIKKLQTRLKNGYNTMLHRYQSYHYICKFSDGRYFMTTVNLCHWNFS